MSTAPSAPPRALVTAISPSHGPAGSTVIITDQHFTGTTAVAFGKNPATDFTVDSDTQITAVVPDRTSKGRVVQVRVRTAGTRPSPTGRDSRYTYSASS